MTNEEKQKLFEEQMFKKKWAKHLKLSPLIYAVANSVGKAPACNTRGPKKEASIVVDNKKKKK